MFIKGGKSGQIGPTTIVGIVLVVGAVILGLLFYFGIFGNKDLEARDLCKLSILTRATTPGVAQQAVPLNCYTEKICITTKDVPKDSEPRASPGLSPFAIFGDKKSDCEQFAGEENFRDVYVRVGDLKYNAETRKTIEQLYADAMYNCWMMTGQGKLDVFRGETTGSLSVTGDILATITGSNLGDIIREIKPQCLVCSRIAISDKLVKADKSRVLSEIDFNKYLTSQKVPDNSGLTYLQKFTDESARGFAGTDGVNFSDKISISNSIDSNQIAMIFMQIRTEAKPEDIAGEAAWLTGTAFVGGVMFTGTGRKIALSGPVGFIGTILAGLGATGGAYLYAEGVQKDNQAVSLASCGKYTNEKDAKLGCSLIKPVKWEVNSVNNLCSGGIKGNL